MIIYVGAFKEENKNVRVRKNNARTYERETN
ncbi:hypothetical protein FHS15_001791 [Paenibacillus castaneae]|nr:hypothetical protein [Paenibacillus castaneae]